MLVTYMLRICHSYRELIPAVRGKVPDDIVDFLVKGNLIILVLENSVVSNLKFSKCKYLVYCVFQSNPYPSFSSSPIISQHLFDHRDRKDVVLEELSL
jgi:hypothetical protein